MNFTRIQQSFMDYIKEPSRPLPKGTEARRMKIYRDLFFNNINGFVSSAFPVLKSLYAEEAWLALIQKFFVTHDSQTPIFIEIAQEFVSFLQSEYQLTEGDPAFIIELAHYEYMELVVAVAKDNPLHQGMQGPITQVALCLSDTAKVLQYRFDVQRVSEDYRPDGPAESPLNFCLYRDKQDEVIFLQLNPLAAQALGYLCQYESVNFDYLVTWLKQTYPQMDDEVLTQGCKQMLVELAAKGVVKQYLANGVE
ncbi:HvfC family RiPP maturation protein [Shewanella violacea]|uniref:Uncharacterized protein n=1 Tax=Shewanella violacea (strain JCM 10179 / CIP 106290 / LMG 19151 / DSS12) TaxID=637905 RepID=D4ZM59_SHEVD|nr:putative DNA-binding domain-containing protein [Shewanella violacea]BAJ02758.1 conserved hypothetical protein [Shewanella violacea DSS12]